MALFPDKSHAMKAWQATGESLNLAKEVTLKDNEISVFFKHLLMQGLQECETKLDRKANVRVWRDHLEFRLNALQLALRLDSGFIDGLGLDSQQTWHSINSSKRYRR
ncbi:MAG: hypothetical protein ACOYMG_27560, partial [Candidatus Methylumidiphilus sp.]